MVYTAVAAMLALGLPSMIQADQNATCVDDRHLGLPPLECPSDNASTDEKIKLGEKLFFDKALSSDNTRSCATCHSPKLGYSDKQPRSFGVEGREGSRHSLSVENACYYKNLMWDGRAGSLEQQALMPLNNCHEMDMDDKLIVQRLRKQGLSSQFRKVFGASITPQRVAAALACYQRTLVGGGSKFDQYMYAHKQDALSEPEKHGLAVFRSANCEACHTIGTENWTLLTDQKFHNIGVGCNEKECDVGRFAISKKPEDWGAFRTPSLRNVAERPPYFHDGSAETLMDAVNFHLKGGITNKNLDPWMKPISLSDQDKDDLVAFLKALSSPHLDAN
jgi:cytochrome c peroxidase